MTREEAFEYRGIIVEASASLDDEKAVKAKKLFPHWQIGYEYKGGEHADRVLYDGKLYKVRQNHTSSAEWTPDIAISLYEEIAEPGTGTKDNPIRYNNNMELIEGLYYTQLNVEYYCFRSTGTAVYNNLADLVNIYVRVAEAE